MPCLCFWHMGLNSNYGAALLWDLDVFIEKMKGMYGTYGTIEETILELGKSQAE